MYSNNVIINGIIVSYINLPIGGKLSSSLGRKFSKELAQANARNNYFR